MKYELLPLSKLCTLTNGYPFKSKDFCNQGIPVIKIANVKPNQIIANNLQYVSNEVALLAGKSKVHKGDILLTMTGNRFEGTPDSWVGKAARFNLEGDYLLNQRLCIVRPNDNVNPVFLSYALSSWNAQLYFVKHATSSGGQANISPKIVNTFEISCPPIVIQDKIASVLRSLDDKISINHQINDNLLQQAQALYREMFVKTTNDQRRICRAEEYFDIAIGKTPPRKERHWFTTNPSDVTWVSISDMGSCGTYISRSSEQLTQEAVNKFNIKVIPSNTILLSFKLTVGRIAITHGEMTTNEAIAHFKTDKLFINEYLYCYLRDFNYQTMGSTSSIATAVNSKIIKAMPFIIPADDEISRFHSIAGPMFEQILNNQLENDSLVELRDCLLPRLMSGEIDVSNVAI